MKIRAAHAEDAMEISALLRRSIVELCQADHHDQPKLLADWLQNKTPENVARWIAHRKSCLLVALAGDGIAAVGGITMEGEIILNYVLPEARFQGHGKALLRALEQWAVGKGLTRCALNSTATAHRFYRAAGYADDSIEEGNFGEKFVRMSKPLCAAKAGDMTGVA